MNAKATNESISEIAQLCKECVKSFPYTDCRTLLSKGESRYEDFIPHLDLYFSSIAGYCSWGNGVFKWSHDRLQEAREKLGETFFDKHPQYKPFESMITVTDTPDLYTALLLHERIRRTLLILLAAISREREEQGITQTSSF